MSTTLNQARTLQERTPNLTRLVDLGFPETELLPFGFHAGQGSSGYEGKTYTIGTEHNSNYFLVDFPLRTRKGFRKFINTVLVHSLSPKQEPTALFTLLPDAYDYSVDSLVLDNEFNSPLVASYDIHVPRTQEPRIFSVMGHIIGMAGEFPKASPDISDIEWHTATYSDIEPFERSLAEITAQ